MDKVREIFELLEQTPALLKLMAPAPGEHGVQVKIGTENTHEAISNCSLITATYSIDGKALGSIGILGPTRMEYARVIGILNVLSHDLTKRCHTGTNKGVRQMSQGQHSQVDGDERYSTLLNNSNAVRAVTSAVEGTLGPKGLDVMLVGPRGEVVITNDGVTILDKMDVTRAFSFRWQEREKIGDGTTTATVLAGALVQEGVSASPAECLHPRWWRRVKESRSRWSF